ncbi:MAG: hypothetical protein FJX74_11355 [Armatimonadetes bacterium]|nr:hypothetical protein [Armatimonadota bacterium]
MAEGGRFRWDALRSRVGRALLGSAAFPFALQAAALVGLALALVNGWGGGLGVPADQIMTLRKTNLTTLLVWGLWWPAMIAGALALGRAWCTVCPMELVNRCGDLLARRGGWKRWSFAPWMRSGWLVIVGYVALQLSVAGLLIHRVPHYTSTMLVLLLGAALATGLLFREPRSFCKGLCPAKALLTAYGRLTPVQLDVRDPQRCADCATRECVSPARQGRFDGRSCPSLLKPWDRRPSDNCVLCLECAKACPYGNVGLGVVRSNEGARRPERLRPYEAAFVMLAAGFVAHEVIGEVKPLDAAFHLVPQALHDALPVIDFGWFEAFWFLGLFPLGLWAVTALIAYAVGQRGALRDLLIAAATAAAPVVAVAHVAKAAAKVSSWGGYLPMALREPRGLETLRAIVDHAVEPPGALLGLPALGWVMLAGVALVAWRSCGWVRHAVPEGVRAATVGALVPAAFFAAALVAWWAM